MSTIAGPRGATARASLFAFLVAFATLFLQVLVHRMVSAKLLNNYAFLVISLTMLGFALSGVILTRILPRFLAARNEALTTCTAGFAVSAVAVSALFYHLDAGSGTTLNFSAFLAEAARSLLASLLFALPFTFAGLMLGALLSDPGLSTARVYGFDLAGSAVGAFAVVAAIRRLGVESSLLLACALLVMAGALLAPPRRRLARAAGIAALVAVALCAATRERLFVMRPRQGSMLAHVKSLGPPYRVEYQQWDPVARIEVSRIPPPDPATTIFPCLIGDQPALLRQFRRMLTQNDYAFTYMVDWDGRPESLAGVERTIYAAAYEPRAVASPRVLVIGVGGGFDVLTALHFGASEVTGVEINSATLDVVQGVYREECRPWAVHPRVRLVADEGRHYLATRPARYDVLQLSGVDSYSGTPGAAHVFSESYLYTNEAFDLYLSRLSDAGILNVMRLEHKPPREMLRALVTAVAALRRTGVTSPADHVVTVTARNGFFTALLVKRTPFTADELARLAAWAGANPFLAISAAPGANAARTNVYQYFLELRSPMRERAFVDAYAFDVSPASDDRPFFFKHSSWSHLLSRNPVLRASVPVMETTLLLLAATVGLVALLCVWLPLRHLARPGGGRSPAATTRFAGYFAAIGLGYFAVEIALLQRFSLFLGHPNYALSVVLAALLVASGAGALLSPAVLRVLRQPRFVSYALAGVVLLERLLFLPLLPGLTALAFALRVAVVFALVLPVGALLGVYLPIGMERLKQGAPPLVPWAWGINGIASVLAPVLAVALSMTWGMDVLLLCALPVYLAAGWLLPAAAAERSAAAVA